MCLIFHQFVTDFRRLRWPLLGVWLLDLIAARAIHIWAQDSGPTDWFRVGSSTGFPWILSVLAFLTAAILCLWTLSSEAPPKPLGYARTKPWPWASFWLGKWFFLVTAVVLPLAVASLSVPWSLGIPMGSLDDFFLHVLLSLLVLLTIPFVAVFITNRMGGATLIGGVLFVVVGWWLFQDPTTALFHRVGVVNGSPLGWTDERLQIMNRRWMAKFALVIGFLAVLMCFRKSMVMAPVFGASAILVVTLAWPFSFPQRNPQVATGVEVRLGTMAKSGRLYGSSSEEQKGEMVLVAGECGLLPKPYFVVPWAFHGTATTDRGLIPQSQVRPVWIDNLAALQPGRRQARRAAILGRGGEWEAEVVVPLLYDRKPTAHGWLDRVEGEVEAALIEPRRITSFPLDTNGWQVSNGARFRAQREGATFHAQVMFLSAPLSMGADSVSLNRMVLMLRDPKNHRVLYESYGSYPVKSLFGHACLFLRVRVDEKNCGLSIPAGAQWVLLEERWMGNFRLPVEKERYFPKDSPEEKLLGPLNLDEKRDESGTGRGRSAISLESSERIELELPLRSE